MSDQWTVAFESSGRCLKPSTVNRFADQPAALAFAKKEARRRGMSRMELQAEETSQGLVMWVGRARVDDVPATLTLSPPGYLT